MKKYPFSAAKNAHNIELVMNRAYNLSIDAAEAGNIDESIRLMKIHDDAQEVLSAVMLGCWENRSRSVALLDGPMLGRAKELSMRGCMIRDGMNIEWENGRRN